MNKKMKWLTLFASMSMILAACSAPMDHSSMDHDMGSKKGDNQNEIALKGEQPQEANAKGNVIELTAKESFLKTREGGNNWPVWSYNGTVPGPTVRVKQGETVRVKLNNQLPEPVTIHWHGLPVPNRMDGVAGVTQNAVEPGKSFTYEFKADVPPGTYWYHSHQKSAEQVDKGLYGTVIVEPKSENPTVDRDYTLVMDEWMEPSEANKEHSGHGTHGTSTSSGEKKESEESAHTGHHSAHGDSGSMGMDHMENYKVFTINGGTYPHVEPLRVKKGERVKLRLVNAGFMTHQIHVHGHEIKVTHVDGQPVHRPETFKDQLIPVAPGERVEVEFIANKSGEQLIECHGEMQGSKYMKIPIQSEDASGSKDQPGETRTLPVLDLSRYGKPTEEGLQPGDSYDREYVADLNEQMDHSSKDMKMAFTINGKTFEDAKPFQVKKGDKVKIRLVNKGKQDHPMHLHGHHFRVLTKDGKPLKGSPIMKDTINVRPGESYEIAFTADNPGDWMLHCHDLHHAADGMATMVKYEGYQSFKPDPEVENVAE